jgi:glycosyltransferase involved in cell wall biosynthesis
MMSSNLVSVIIPVYNSGQYLFDAIKSCFDSSFTELEIVLVNDGSTDPSTMSILESINFQFNVRIFHKTNSGPASARNFGVKNSKGDFLLFLDSDNLIRSDYLKKAIALMNQENDLGVVYSKPAFFGANQADAARFEVREFYFDALLSGNYIDMCSLVRKEAFLEVGGFDENQNVFFGEDWDLWIRIAQKGWKFYFLNEVLFNYRIREESLMGQINLEKRSLTLNYLGAKHGFVIHQRYRQYFRVMDQIQKNPLSYFLRILYYKYIKRQPFMK